MSRFDEFLLWCAVQVAAISISSGLLALMVRRWTRSPASAVLLAGFALNVSLAAVLFVPWPSWWNATAPGAGLEASSKAMSPDELGETAQAAPPGTRPSALDVAARVPVATTPALATIPESTIRWGAIAALGLLVVFGLQRFISGLVGLRSLLHNSTPIADHRLVMLAGEVAEAMEMTRPVELRESAMLTTAAAAGWRRPVILLPGHWREWSPDVLRAVIAHEMAHLSRSHFAIWLCAQASLTVHFYHPVAHWLAHLLKLEQEYEADALAARHLQSREQYVEALAQLALAPFGAEARWPVRAFLPTQSTLMRRIAMLRQWRPASSRTRGTGLWPVAILLVCGAIVSGLRPSMSPAFAAEKAVVDGGRGAVEVITQRIEQAPVQAAPFREKKAAVEPTAADYGAALAEMQQALAVTRNASFQRLKRIGRAFHEYAAEHDGQFPPAVIYDEATGVPRSWRVELLKYLGAADLAAMYRSGEVWDSENNLKVLAQIPDVYKTTPHAKDSKTAIVVATGPGTLFDGKEGKRLSEIKDGTSWTILAFELPPTAPAFDAAGNPVPPVSMPRVEWTKPVDLAVDLKATPPDLQLLNTVGFCAVQCDGSARRYSLSQSAGAAAAMLTPAGAEQVDVDKL